LIDHSEGGWFPEVDSALQPVDNIFVGKPDIYHAIQACLIPLKREPARMFSLKNIGK